MTTVPIGGSVGSLGVVHVLQEEVDHDATLRVGDEVDLASGLFALHRAELLARAGAPTTCRLLWVSSAMYAPPSAAYE